MSFLTVHHATVYRYKEPVGLGEHRMMFRPRASHDLRLIRTKLVITPQPVQLRWLHDPFDNSVAVATFEGTTSELRFESTVTLEHFENSMLEYSLEEYARAYPFRYSDEDFPNLARALAHQYPVENVAKWALQFLDPSDTTGTMKILRAMTRGIREEFIYTPRIEKGVQPPEETLRRGRGCCRDFAALMIEAEAVPLEYSGQCFVVNRAESGRLAAHALFANLLFSSHDLLLLFRFGRPLRN